LESQKATEAAAELLDGFCEIPISYGASCPFILMKALHLSPEDIIPDKTAQVNNNFLITFSIFDLFPIKIRVRFVNSVLTLLRAADNRNSHAKMHVKCQHIGFVNLCCFLPSRSPFFFGLSQKNVDHKYPLVVSSCLTNIRVQT